MLNRACTFYQRKKCMHILIWNYNGCTSYLMLLLFGETLVIHRFRERLRERETQSHSFSPYLCTGI